MAIDSGEKKGFMKQELTNDGCHPTDAGYAIMEPLILQAIRKIVKVK